MEFAGSESIGQFDPDRISKYLKLTLNPIEYLPNSDMARCCHKVQRFYNNLHADNIPVCVSSYQFLDSDHNSWRKCQDFQHCRDILCLHSTHLHKGTRPSVNVITGSRNIIAAKIYEHIAPALALLNPYHRGTKLHVYTYLFAC